MKSHSKIFLFDDQRLEIRENWQRKLFNLMLPKTSVYVKRYDGETKWMHFCIEDDE